MIHMKTKKPSIVFLSGTITGVKGYKQFFSFAEEGLKKAGFIVLNPAELPQGMPYEAYMPITLAMVAAADTVVVLPDSGRSRGVAAEVAFARSLGKQVVYY